MSALKIAWQEFKVALRSPSFYFVMALFLFYQGIVFSVTVALRHHPLSPPGPLLAPFFGGPFWFWPLLILVVVELSHGALSKMRLNKTLELLLAAPLSPRSVVVGKFLGLVGLLGLLWLLTLPLILLLLLYLPAQNTPALTPLLTGYLGALLVGSAGLALGILFSSFTTDTRLSGMLTFITLFLLVLMKILVDSSYGIVTSAQLIKILSWVNFLDYMEGFSRGVFNPVHLVVLLSISWLSVLGASLTIGHSQKQHVGWALVDLLLVALVFLFILVTVGRKTVLWHGEEHPLDQRLTERIRTLPEPVSLYLFTMGKSSNFHFAPIAKLESLLNRLAAKGHNLSWRRVDIQTPGLYEKRLAKRFGLTLASLREDRTGLEKGVLVVETGTKHRVIPLSRVVSVVLAQERIVFKGIRLESELASALAFLTNPKGRQICITGGHGERSLFDPGAHGLTRLGIALKAAGWTTRILAPVAAPLPSSCQALLLLGPKKPFLPSELEAVETFLARGGGLLLLMDEEAPFPSGLAGILAKWNLFPEPYRILDRGNSVGKSGGWLWATQVKGSLEKRNWRLILEAPREIAVKGGAEVLLDSSTKVRRLRPSSSSWGSQPTKVRRGRAHVGVKSGAAMSGRLSLLGFTVPYLNKSLSSRGASSDASMELFQELLSWTAREKGGESIPPMAIRHHHLRLRSAHIRSIHLFGMLILPLIALSLGFWMAFKRRR